MARLHSDHSQRGVDREDGIAQAQGKPCAVYRDAAGQQPANLAVYDSGTPGTPGSVITGKNAGPVGTVDGTALEVDEYSLRPAFWDLDDLPRLWISIDKGPLVAILPDPQPLIEAAATAAAAQATAAQAAAIAASVPRVGGKNLFDKAVALGGKFWNGVGSSPITLANWYASPPIPVTAGQTYSITGCRNYQWMTAALGNIEPYGNNPSEGPVTQVAPPTAAYLAINVSPANLATAQVEVGSSVTAYEPYGYVVQRQVAGGRYLDDVAGDANALRRMPGVTVYRAGNSLLVRSAFDATRDILMPWSLSVGEESMVAPAIDFTSAGSNVTLVPSSTSDVLVWPTIATGTQIHGASDDNAPINSQWAYIGGNHGWTAGWTVTAAGHGKATADVGSTWSDGTRTYTLLAVLSASQLLVGGPYSVSSGVVTGSVGAPAATLTHVSGATSTASIPITGGVANTQIHPSSYAHSVTVALDGRPLPDGKAAGQVLTISESYLIASYKGMVDWAQANIGTPVLSNLSAVPAYARVSNTYRITAAQVVVAQRVTAIEKCTLNVGVTQAFPLTLPAGGSRRQHMPGVGTVNSVDWRTNADLTAFSTQTDITAAGWLSPLVPPASMTQWAYNASGIAQYGFAMGILPTGDGHPSQRLKNAAGKAWFIAGSTKKSYPQLAWGRTLLPGESLSGTAYRRYLAPPAGPTELVVSDGADTWAIIERTDTVTEARMAAPELLGRRLVPAWASTAVSAEQVTGEGIGYRVPAGPGYTVLLATGETPRIESAPGATSTLGSYFITQQGPISAQAFTGSYQIQYFWQVYLPEPVWVDQACVEVTALGTGVIRHGVYLHDPATGMPTPAGPLADYGTIDVTSTGIKTSALSPTVLLPAGVHWYTQAWQASNTTAPTIRVVNAPPGVGPLTIGTNVALMSGARMGYFVAGVTGAFGAVALNAANAHQLLPPRLAYRRA